VDQQPGQVFTALEGLDDLPLARASVRQEFLRRSRRWREQMQEETSRLREQFQQAGGRFEERVEGWLEEPPWDAPDQDPALRQRWDDGDDDFEPRPPAQAGFDPEPWEEPWEDLQGSADHQDQDADWWDQAPAEAPPDPGDREPRRRRSAPAGSDDPWI
jgi:hypothetical protein